MPYCTQQDVINSVGLSRVIQWSDDDGQGVINPIIVTAALVWADDQINTALSKRFQSYLPFATPPRAIFQVAVTFSVWALASRMQETGELWKERYAEAVKLLEQIAAGEIDLIAVDGTNLTKESPLGSSGTVYLPQITDTEGLMMPTALNMYRRYNAGLTFP